ncbi:hypothetical protein AU255_15790 [Methyloprofundus sedimenti]|uniref:Sensor protein FixL n=1 Tax=Methyloprofundus sedimenti TaxID=1420851 RepID=A0A1V8M2G1_9GAMM|nr:PAS domain S-box protein [Methyloprofundus sedimenti]OQK15676.1 hypothetical protein AU255_15790 [Methyloprofundus sedimenti]
MSIKNTNDNVHQQLRQKKEIHLGKTRTDIAKLTPEEIQKLAHEFQVYQVALEMQNEELRETQIQLRASRDRYQTLFEYAPIGFLTLDRDSNISNANQKACVLLEYSKTDLLGAKFAKYLNSEDQGRFYLFFQQLLKSVANKSFEISVMQANGYSIPVLCQGYYHEMSDTAEKICFITLLDISEQKHIEKQINELNKKLNQKVSDQHTELQMKNQKLLANIAQMKDSKNKLIEGKARLKSVFNAAVESIITINERGIIISINNAVTNIFGYQASELIGHNVGKLMPSPYKEQHNNYIQNYLVSRQAKIIGSIRQLEARRKDGSIFPIDLSISEYQIAQKTYFTGIIRDVSERKRKDLLDKQHLNELAHVTRMGLMGEMASGIAHEVNQPLTAIATYSQVCLRMLKSDKLDLIKLQETLQKTETQALRAGQVLARMREFISTNTVHRSTIDINHLIHDAMSLLADDFRHSSIQSTLDLADSLPCLSVDEVQIEQVILNLIKNSIDALALLPRKTKRRISIQTYLLVSSEIEVRIKDNGAGMDNEEQALLFTPFFTTKTSGMGMGLSISQSLIRAHGGMLRFRSSKGKGSTFYFTLPILEDKNGH